MDDTNTSTRDAAILSEYRKIGDATRLAEKYGISKVDVYRIIHGAKLAHEIAKATEYAQSVMRAGEMVFALPANALEYAPGAEAIVDSLQSAIKANKGDFQVLIGVAVVPVEEVIITEPYIKPEAIAATLQAKAINGGKKHEKN